MTAWLYISKAYVLLQCWQSNCHTNSGKLEDTILGFQSCIAVVSQLLSPSFGIEPPFSLSGLRNLCHQHTLAKGYRQHLSPVSSSRLHKVTFHVIPKMHEVSCSSSIAALSFILVARRIFGLFALLKPECLSSIVVNVSLRHENFSLPSIILFLF